MGLFFRTVRRKSESGHGALLRVRFPGGAHSRRRLLELLAEIAQAIQIEAGWLFLEQPVEV